jgi:hypothetical protein
MPVRSYFDTNVDALNAATDEAILGHWRWHMGMRSTWNRTRHRVLRRHRAAAALPAAGAVGHRQPFGIVRSIIAGTG